MRFDGVDLGSGWRPPQLLDFYPDGPSRGEEVTWRISETLAKDSWFLMGDAAAVLDPASSHGVLKALMSGMQVAHLLTQCLQGRLTSAIATQHYSQWLRTWFDSDVSRLRELYWGEQDSPLLQPLL